MDIKQRISIISVPEKSTIRQTMEAIERGALGMALIIEPETRRFVGLVTDGDIRRALLGGYGLESKVVDIPRPIPKTARVEMALEQITGLFSEPIRVIPLLNENEQVVDLAIFDSRVHIQVAEPLLGAKELLYVNECILTGWVSSAGKFVARFEEIFAEFCATRYAVATSSGTAALHLALLALGIGSGDEVIVPSLTFIATANAVAYTGAKPVFLDSEPKTWNIDTKLIENAVTSRTKAIIPVHLYGYPADMDPIVHIAAKYKLAVIEDAAEAHGARYKGRCVGGIGDIGVFSFYGNKIVTTGEGGMVVTNRADVADKVKMLRNHGISSKRQYWHPALGYNYRLSNIQAALGVAQMEKIGKILQKKQLIAKAYQEGLSDIAGITTPPKNAWAEGVYWMYSILVDKTKFGMSRDDLMSLMQRHGIETRPFFPAVHTQPIYDTGEKLPVSEYLSENGINLPSAVTLQPEEIQRICRQIRTRV